MSVFHTRLALDFVAAVLLLFCFSYWWLGNAAHELAGTAMFSLVVAHNVFNRRWHGKIAMTSRRPHGLFDVLATVCLLAAMLVLLGTSVLISNALPGLPAPFGSFSVRQIHTLAAYWVLVLVAVHLGLRGPLLLGVASRLFGTKRPNAARTIICRAIAVVVVAHGVWSSYELGLGAKLTMQMTLDWWNFEESVAGFFIHCAAVAGLYIVLTYYIVAWIQRHTHRRSTSASSVAQNVYQETQGR